MRAMVVARPESAPDGAGWLELVEVDPPVPAAGEILVRVAVCAVCRTDLDVADGRLAVPQYPRIPGHQVLGRVVTGDGNGMFRPGDRVGIAWIHSACGVCRWCRGGQENLCPDFQSTGCDADGGYAEYISVPAAFAHVIPGELPDELAAPLLCAGAVGWRSLRLARLANGDPLGLSGFGASGHVVLQLARHRYPASPIFVFARNAEERAFARELGAEWTGEFGERPPAGLGAVIDTTPAWKPVVDTMRHLIPGGRLVINAIRKMNGDREELLRLEYTDLWMERAIQTVANVTRADVREMLDAAVEIGLRPTVTELPLERANEALERMRRGDSMRGATVLRVQGA
jgi:alcohol dehydrogenase, propanol-preferring